MDKKDVTILVVEDELPLQEAITTKLRAIGAKSISYESGLEALKFLQLHEVRPDAIWLDYYVKDLNGIEFMSAIKSDPALDDIPVVVVSNSASPEKVHQMLALGAKKYLLKAEYKLDDIVTTVLDLIGKERNT